MNGVLGGFRNMLKRWRINFKNKKKQESQEQVSKYRFKSFIYSLIAIISCPIGLTLNNKNKQDRQLSENDLVKIDQDKKTDNLIIKSDLNEVKLKYFNSKVKIYQSNHISLDKNGNKIITSIGVFNESKLTMKQSNDRTKKNVNQKHVNKENSLVWITPILDKVIEKKDSFASYNNLQEKKFDNKLHPVDIQKDNMFDESININELEEIKLRINELVHKIADTTQYNDLYLYEKNLKELLEKAKNIQIKLNKTANFSKSVAVVELIERQFINISVKKDELYYKTTSFRRKNADEKTKENNKQLLKQEEKKNELNECIKAQKLIFQDIVKQNKLFVEYLLALENSVDKRKTTTNYLQYLSFNLLNFTFSLLPILVFQNPFLGYLVSAYMINNSVKTMRKMLNPHLNINYEFFHQYKNNKDILHKFDNLCNDTLNEIGLLKLEIKQFGNKQLLQEIELIEINILKQRELITEKSSLIDKVFIKVKDKIG